MINVPVSASVNTLEQAEIALYRAGAVMAHEGQQVVEGKQLLDLCGFAYTDRNWGDKLNRQFERHGLVEGQDYQRGFSPNDGGILGGRPRTNIYVSINAANHILLAAMTDEGKAARQDAIDTKMATQVPTTTAAFAHLFNQMLMVEQKTTEVDQKLHMQSAQIERIENTINTGGCDEGYLIRNDAYRMYGRGLSKDTFKLVLDRMEVQQSNTYITMNGFQSLTTQVHQQQTIDAIESFYEGLVRVSNTRYTHPLLSSRTFKA